MGNTSLHYLLRSGKNSKALYYLRAVLLDMLPDSLFRKRLKNELETCRQLYDEEYVADRVNYYCKTPASNDELYPDITLKRIGDFHRKGHSSMYYYDSREVLRWFNHDLCWHYLFGDIREIPPYPTIVKSRSTQVDNTNSVLLKLNRNRHFVFVRDKIPFEQKKDQAIFRGQVGTRHNRQLFINRFSGNSRVDAANTLAKGGLLATNPDKHPTSPRLSIYDHLKYRYIMALEGNDVASNLKWVMSSNSLAVSPPLTCETWFMEGRLKAGVHYVGIRDDFEDLEEKMDYYSTHTNEAQEIIHNANQWTTQFKNTRRERYISLLVMLKYFKLYAL